MRKIKLEVTNETKKVGLAALVGAAIGAAGYTIYNLAKGIFKKDKEDEDLDDEDLDDEELDEELDEE